MRLSRRLFFGCALFSIVSGGIITLIFGGSYMAAIISVLGAAGIFATGSYANYIYFKPLQNLLSDIRAVRYGRCSEFADLNRHDEFGDLAHEFQLLYTDRNRLGLELEDIHKVIERKVLYRTSTLMRLVRRLKKHTDIESLTGLANRRHLDKCSGMVFDDVVRNNNDMACIIIDVDNFKQVNDHWGHATGDAIIIFVAELIQALTRQGDMCARYGGDEFMVLLPKCNEAEAGKIAERIRLHFAREVRQFFESESARQSDAKINDKNIKMTNNTAIKISNHIEPRLSMGIATLKKNRPSSINDLMQMADKALYDAKEKGRNRVMEYRAGSA
jgi:diguanylate cyclase (GGDEF)-like protein